MNIGITIALILGGLLFIPAVTAFVFWDRGFNYRVEIIKQVGKDPNDVIRVRDRFKVRQKNGVHTIIFRNQMRTTWSREETPSIPFRYWTKYLKKEIKYTDDQWNNMDLSRSIKRGLLLYQSTEGDYRPIEFAYDKEGVKAKILSQDNRRWTVSKLREESEFTLSKTQQLIVYGGITIAFIIMGVAFVMFLIYLSESAANLCAFGQSTTSTFIQGAQAAVGG